MKRIFIMVSATSIRNKITDVVANHPRLVTFGISLAITFSLGLVIGMLDPNQALAAAKGRPVGV